VTKRDKKRVYAGIGLLIAVLFCAGIFAGYVSRNDKLCADGKAPTRQRPDATLGHVVYQCHNGQLITR
jgi:hypothetical protein